MILFETDEPQNLFVIRYSGAVTPEETERGLEEIRAALAKLRSSFRLLVDLTELAQMDIGCAPYIEKAMDLCNEKGPSLVVRVIPDPHRDIGMAIMSMFHYGGSVQIITCQTLAEAAELLRAQT
jgi:anti-anti-sigma regulatory factor